MSRLAPKDIKPHWPHNDLKNTGLVVWFTALRITPCKGIQDSLDGRNSKECGNPPMIGIRNPTSTDKESESTAWKYSAFQSPKFRIPQATIFRILKSAFPYMGRFWLNIIFWLLLFCIFPCRHAPGICIYSSGTFQASFHFYHSSCRYLGCCAYFCCNLLRTETLWVS